MSMLIIKLNIKVLVIQIIYFTLRFCLKPMFHTPCIDCERVFYVQTKTEIILEIILFLGLTVSMCYHILKTRIMYVMSFQIGLSFFVLFELSKYIEYMTGFLPHYGDIPIVISLILSLVVTTIYACILYFICLLIRRYSINQ